MTTQKQFLGLDIGNAKVKCCWISNPEPLETASIRWESLPLPTSQNRTIDFKQALPMQILAFLDHHDLSLAEIDTVVICCSHSLSFATFSESITLIAQSLWKLFKDNQAFLIRADGQLTPLTDMADLCAFETIAYTFTNFYGSAFLGSRLIQNGLSLDLGTTTLDVIPIINGQIDPQGLGVGHLPSDYLRFRYANSRIHWLGLTATSLTALSQQVPLGAELFEIVPRHYKTDLLLALMHDQISVPERDLLARHAYGRNFPDYARAEAQLAQFIGLDPTLISDQERDELLHYLWNCWLNKLSAAIRKVAESSFADPEQIEIACFALGEQILLQPALERAGFKASQLKTLRLDREQALWSASSVFAMAVIAAEHGLQTQLDIA